jgi:hypothetical protein
LRRERCKLQYSTSEGDAGGMGEVGLGMRDCALVEDRGASLLHFHQHYTPKQTAD